jgi:hypothetical protein
MNNPGKFGQHINLTSETGQVIEVKESHNLDAHSRFKDEEESKSLIQSKSHSFMSSLNTNPHQNFA